MVNQTELFTPVQITNLLPTQRDIRELMMKMGCEGDETIPKIEKAINQITAAIIASPTNFNLWRDLAHAFGLVLELQWKYLFIAQRLSPDNLAILGDIAWTCDMLGDHQQAVSILNQRLAVAENDDERAKAQEDICWMQFQERSQSATVGIESLAHH
jgi:tetratricopeptide (TPR) repeat protein